MPGPLPLSRSSFVETLEALYALEPEQERWARGVLAAIERVMPFASGSPEHPDPMVALQVSTAGPAVDVHMRQGFQLMYRGRDGRDLLRTSFYPARPVATHEEIARSLSGRQLELFKAMRVATPARDALGLFAYPEPGHALCLWALSDREVAVRPVERRALMQLVGHLDASARLRTRPDLAIAAVATPDGALVDIADAAAKPIRSRLGARVATIERARQRGPRRTLEAIADWQALVAGRYSVVPREDRDGRRFYLLIANTPPAEVSARFSPREVEVVRLAARGFTNKTTAYALGLSPAAASTALASAAAKLGLRARLDLIHLARALFGASEAFIDTSKLTAVEREVVELVRRGKSNAEIADLRGRSVHTVANQVSSLLAKLGVPSRRALGVLTGCQ